jgi:hypothetical protein
VHWLRRGTLVRILRDDYVETLHPLIKEADLRALVSERRDFMPEPIECYRVTDSVAWSWTDGIEPTAAVPLPTFSTNSARAMFLARYAELTQEG